jgi:hypothetical protein
MNFTDVHTTDWFYEYVQCMYCRGAISGYADHTFRPMNNTIRGQMTKIVVLAFAYTIHVPTNASFSDVPPTDAFYRYIETASYYNIVSGYNDGTFRTYNNVTRGQLSKITANAARWQLINPSRQTFSDVAPGSAFYQYVETAVCRGVVDGYNDGTFRPDNFATRAQICKIVCLATRNPAPCDTP